MAEKKEKYIVIKRKDLKALFDNNRESSYAGYPTYPKNIGLDNDIQAFHRVLKLLDHKQNYLVINLKEPYAEPMWQILLAFEDLKAPPQPPEDD